jgi:hypothetical protein
MARGAGTLSAQIAFQGEPGVDSKISGDSARALRARARRAVRTEALRPARLTSGRSEKTANVRG